MVSISGNTLVQLVGAIAPELGPYQQFMATATSGANDLVISSDMADSEAPPEKYGGYYLYANSGGPAGQQQRVKRNGFTGSTGTFQTAKAYANTPPVQSLWTLLGTMPWIDQDGLTGIRTCINRALRKLWIRYHHPIASTGPSVTEYDLGALWWAKRERFLRLLDPDPSGTGHPVPSATAWDVVQNADVWTLQLGSGFAAGKTFFLVCEVPANYRLKLSGTWSNQSSPTAGLVADADACLGDWNHVVQCSLYECFKQLAVQAGGARKAYWTGRAAEQRAVVAALKAYQLADDGEALGEGPTNAPAASALDESKGLFSGGVF